MSGNANSENPKGAIIEALRKHPEGLTFKDIAELVGHHRHTVTKYVYELIGAQVIIERDIGAAKLCYLRENFRGGNDRRVNQPLGNFWKGQAQLVALFMVLLLVPATIIVAQNATNSTAVLEGMAVAFDAGSNGTLDDNVSVPISGPNGTTIDTSTGNGQNETDITEISELNGTSENFTIPDVTGPEENGTNITIPEEELNFTEENLTLNETENETIPVEENITYENITTEENATPAEPDVLIEIINPEKITRGESFLLKAVVSNRGAKAENVVIEWVLPDFFEITEGNKKEKIETFDANMTFSSEILVSSRIDASLGASEIMVRVSYE